MKIQATLLWVVALATACERRLKSAAGGGRRTTVEKRGALLDFPSVGLA